MENISDFVLRTIREDEKNGIMCGWIEEKRFIILPNMARMIEHIMKGGSLIVLTDRDRQWFGDYIISFINQPHKGRPFFPITQVKYLHKMIDDNATEGGIRGFELISSMLDMLYQNYRFWYIGKKNVYANFAKSTDNGWYWIFDENDIFNSNDERLEYKLISLFKLFDKAIVAAMLNKISLDI